MHLEGNLVTEDLSNLLLQIGNENIYEDDGKVNMTNNHCAIFRHLKSLSKKIYPNLNSFYLENLIWVKEQTILTPNNDAAASINRLITEK